METYRRLEDLILYEKQLPESDRRWPGLSVREDIESYGSSPCGFPEP